MGKAKKKVKKTRYISPEGYSEMYFIEFLRDLYECDKNNIIIAMPKTPPGGNPDVIIAGALKSNHYDYSLAFLDEDKEIDIKSDYNTIFQLKKCWLNDDVNIDIPLRNLQELNIRKRKPILIVSQPVMFEGFMIRILGKKLPELKTPFTDMECAKYNKHVLKSAFKGIIHNTGRENEIEFYKNNLTINYLEQKAKESPELALLLAAFK